MTNQPPDEEKEELQAEEEGRPSRTLVEAIQRALGFIGGTSVVIAGVGVAAVVLGGILYLASPDLSQAALLTLAVGGVLLLIAGTTSFSAVRIAVMGRRGRYSTNAIIMVLAFVFIAGLVGFVGFRNSTRIDVTATKQFSLAPQTVKILKDLPERVRATAFFVPGDPVQDVIRSRVDDLLHEFDVRSNNFSFRFVDPDTQPAIARQYGEQIRYQSIFIEAIESGRTHPVVIDPQFPLVEEQQFATALLIVTGVERKQVHFLRGHGEKDMTDTEAGGTGYFLASKGLLDDNYEVATLNLRQQEGVPEDVAALVIAGPTQDPTEEETQAIFDYLKAGGRAIFLMDPGAPDSWRDLLANWGVQLESDTIVDAASSFRADPRTIVLQRFQYSPYTPITQDLLETFFPAATAVTSTIPLLDPSSTIFLAPLALTTLDSCQTPSPDDNSCKGAEDRGGPLFPAMAVRALAPLGEQPASSDAPETRMVVFGDSDFATNQFFASFSNGDLFLNSVNWLTEDINLISVRPKLVPFRQLVVSKREFDFIRYSSLLLLPLAVMLLGGVAWWRRR